MVESVVDQEDIYHYRAKSSYTSVEWKLDPLNTNLIVTDESRTEKIIVLAVSPLLRAFGLPVRPQLFEVIQQVERVNN